MTGAVAQIDSKALENRPVQNVSTALQGTMPGVQVTSGGGRPGQDGGTIRVRGVGTLNTADPYILVDGIETGTMNSVDPNDIERDVYKRQVLRHNGYRDNRRLLVRHYSHHFPTVTFCGS